ncbi:MAG TPA: hypothetical protein VGH29_14845 [Candidatus Binataceae bacterium]|jgi:hypothetical protein
MTQLHIEVSSPVMPISTEFIRFCKAVEQFYYAIAIAAEPDPGKAAAAWRAWLANGLNPAVRLAPPVEGANRIKVDSRPGVGGFDLTVSGANREALARLRTVLEQVDAAHQALDQNAADEARAAALMETQTVMRELVQPLKASVARSQIQPEGAAALMAMIHRGLLAIAAGEISSLAIQLT